MASKGQPHRIFFGGQEYVSALGAAQMLGISVSTLKRLERKGALDRPAPLPRGNQGTRWYAVEKLEEAARRGGSSYTALKEALTAEKMKAPKSWTEFLRTGQRRARPQVDLDAGVDVGHGVDDVDGGWISPAETRDGLGVEVGLPPAGVTPSLCPRCGAELEWRSRSIRGAKAEYNQVAWCPQHGEVDLRLPEPVPDTCIHCGRDPIWEVRDIGGRRQQVPICAEHGITEVHQRQQQPRPEGRLASFPAMPVGDGRRERPRGLYDGFFHGAIRKPPPPSRPKVSFLDPYEGPTRPG